MDIGKSGMGSGKWKMAVPIYYVAIWTRGFLCIRFVLILDNE